MSCGRCGFAEGITEGGPPCVCLPQHYRAPLIHQADSPISQADQEKLFRKVYSALVNLESFLGYYEVHKKKGKKVHKVDLIKEAHTAINEASEILNPFGG
jgi:hypothetical protein